MTHVPNLPLLALLGPATLIAALVCSPAAAQGDATSVAAVHNVMVRYANELREAEMDKEMASSDFDRATTDGDKCMALSDMVDSLANIQHRAEKLVVIARINRNAEVEAEAREAARVAIAESGPLTEVLHGPCAPYLK